MTFTSASNHDIYFESDQGWP